MKQTNAIPIRVQLNRWQSPASFCWQGKKYHIEQIERIWRSQPGQSPVVRLYRVRAGGRRFVLRHERTHNRWSLVRAPWRVRLGLSLGRLAALLA